MAVGPGCFFIKFITPAGLFLATRNTAAMPAQSRCRLWPSLGAAIQSKFQSGFFRNSLDSTFWQRGKETA